jgi:hypothetical protein
MNVRILCDKETLFVSLKVSGQKAAKKSVYQFLEAYVLCVFKREKSNTRTI